MVWYGMKKKIRFGYETKTGKEININLAHTVITGLTHEAGKTTAIMGLIKDYQCQMKGCLHWDKNVFKHVLKDKRYKEDGK